MKTNTVKSERAPPVIISVTSPKRFKVFTLEVKKQLDIKIFSFVGNK